MKVAYIMSRFPRVTETFVLNEIVALHRQGIATTVYPLLRLRERVVHPEVAAIAGRVHHQPLLSLPVLAANWRFLRRRPFRYLAALGEVLRGCWGSANFFFGAIGIFPKAAWLAQQMAREGVTHVHAHFANHPTVAALIVHRLTGIPFSFTAHGHDIHVERRMLREKIQAARFAVMISQYNRRLVLEECKGVDPGKVHVLHCGADTALFAPRAVRRGDRSLSIICVGSLIEVKGHRYLIEACRLLKERGLPVRCHLVGDGPGRSQVAAQIAQAGLEEEVLLHGVLPRPSVARMMSEADVIAQPSVPTSRGSREGIPISLMEGMASGLAVVASRISGIPELVEDGRSGFLLPPGEAAALADALQRLMEEPDLRRSMGEAGRERVLRDFDLARNARKLVELIQEAGSSGKKPLRAGRMQEAPL